MKYPILACLLVLSCQQNKQKQSDEAATASPSASASVPPSAAPSTPPSLSPSPTVDFCALLKAQPQMTQALNEQINQICNNLDALRGADTLYSGGANVPVRISETQSGSVSTFNVVTSFKVAGSAAKIFRLFEISFTEEPTLKTKGFQVDTAQTYTMKENANGIVKFTLSRNADGFTFDFEGAAILKTLQQNSAYAVGVAKSFVGKNLKDVRTLILINQADATNVEVFYSGLESYDNLGDHAGLTTKVQNWAKQRLQRDFANAQTASRSL